MKPQELRQFYERKWLPNVKIPFFFVFWAGFGWIAWHASTLWILVPCYVAMGYLQMSVATVGHECTHNVFFRRPLWNWIFGMGIFSTLIVPYTTYREDHLLHHRVNRTSRDTAAFTMGNRRFTDFLIFYLYIFAGVPLLLLSFLLIHPFTYLKGRKFWLHWAECAAHAVLYYVVFRWAYQYGVLGKALGVWLYPVLVFGVINSMRFLGEHYGTTWNGGEIGGTRSIQSNRANSFFWCNINYHIAHHVYPAVPWYHLPGLQELLLPEIAREGGLVESSYTKVFLRALSAGPETPDRANAMARKTLAGTAALIPSLAE